MTPHPENRLPSSTAARVVLLAFVVVLASCANSSDQLPQVADTASPTTESVTVTSAGLFSRPEGTGVAPLDCFALLPREAVEIALGLDDLPEDERGTYGHGKRETCIKQIPDDENIYVGLEPGAPEDFAPGAQLMGVTGEPVSGVGDVARWFGGTGADGGGVGGILSVSQETAYGFLYFRISLGRPDLDSPAQLQVAKDMALAVLPRFPFVELEESEPELVTFEPDPIDLSVVGYASNLLAKEEAGEWTRQEGLIATLKFFAGEIDQPQVLRHTDLLDYSGSGVVRLAREYLDTGADDETGAEIARLLESLFPSRQQLEEMAGDGSGSGMYGYGGSPSRFLRQGVGICERLYGMDPPCLVTFTIGALDARWPGKYLVFAPLGETGEGWMGRITQTIDALTQSVLKYSTLTDMPPISVTLDPHDHPVSTAVVPDEDGCEIFVYPVMREFREDYYKQILARDVAYCLIENSFLTLSGWWVDGLATYLGGWVYPDVNLEHEYLLNLYSTELNAPLVDRYFDNWVFFEYLHASLEAAGNLNLISSVNASGVNVLADFWHPFNEKLTDAAVQDIGPKVSSVPYEPPKEDIEITGPMRMTPSPSPFGVRRGQMTVESGKKACVTYRSRGDVKASWRSGAVGTAGGGWSTDLPSEVSGISVFLVTATGEGAQLTMKVEKVVDQDKACDEEYLDESADLKYCDMKICDATAFLDKRPP